MRRLLFAAAAPILLICSNPTYAVPTFGADFAADYTVSSLGSVPGLPFSYGGLTVRPDDPNTLLIGGAANTSSGRIYELGVVRDGDNHITGFSSTATPIGNVGEYNDGGVYFGPDDVLFTARWNIYELGQTKLSTLDSVTPDEDRVDAFGPTSSSISALNFVPAGFGGAGSAKAVTWSSGEWFDVPLTPDGSGTFDIGPIIQVDLDPGTPGVQNLPGGPEGFVYVTDTNAGFAAQSMLVSDYSANRVSAYELDGLGNPVITTRRDFLTGLSGAEGAFVDPLTGDFLFSTFGTGSDEVFRVEGFLPTVETGSITGVKWNDLNGDGAIDPGENGLAAWTIELLVDGITVSAVATAADGSYSFTNLLAGDYAVREVLQSGFEQTYGSIWLTPFTLGPSESIANINFGNRRIETPGVPLPGTIVLLVAGVAVFSMRRRLRSA